MTGSVTFEPADADGVAGVVLANPGKHNAIDRAMWAALRRVFETLQTLPPADAPHAVIVSGADGQFASGGDIAEFATFRFDEAQLRHFHEDTVGGALGAMLGCDLPLLARIEGACIGAGFEIAACCDIRICGRSSRFGAPIGRLGFPMAPSELAILARIAAPPVLREMLLEARLLDAADALRLALVHAVVGDDAVEATTRERALRIAALAPNAARLNKQNLRRIAAGSATAEERRSASVDDYAYADSAEHREGIAAFLAKRPPRFD